MKTEEMSELAQLIHATWPSVLSWFAKLTPQVQEVQRKKRDAILGPMEAADVRRAIEELSLVSTPTWQQYGDRPEAAYACIAEHARRFAHARRDANESQRSVGMSRGGKPMNLTSKVKDDVEKFVEAIKAGHLRNAGDIRAWLERDADPRHHDQRDAVYCTLCDDTGTVRVVSSMKWKTDGETRRLAWYTAAAACTCQRGEVYANRKEEQHRLPTYDDTRHVRLVTFATHEDVLAEFSAVRDRQFASKRVASFDMHNERSAREWQAAPDDDDFR